MIERPNEMSSFSKRRLSIALLSLMGARIMSFPYNGKLLYLVAGNNSVDGNIMLYVSLLSQVTGLILGGIFVIKAELARKILIIMMPVNILCVVTFIFLQRTTWIYTLALLSISAGLCITATAHFIQDHITYKNRYRTVAELLIIIFVLKLFIDNISLYISIQAGIVSLIVIMVLTWFLSIKITRIQKEKFKISIDKKASVKAPLLLLLLFLFVTIFSIDFGIMVQSVNPNYKSIGWPVDWFWIIPYLGGAFLMRQIKTYDDRRFMINIAVGAMGFGFIIFMVMDFSLISYLIVTTVMMSAWAVSDVFWWSILGEMLEIVKNPASVLSVGYSAIMLGLLLGVVIANSGRTETEASLSIVSMAVICLTLIILPILHRLLSGMIKNIKDYNTAETKTGENNSIYGVECLTERESQIVSLLLKGRTCKLIAAELYLSENTVKTHIKNIYSKMGIRRKSELFNAMLE